MSAHLLPPPLNLLALPAFTDNYIWLLHDGSQAWVVDPGDATPVKSALADHGLSLKGILLTHHHSDHTGGVRELVQATGAVVYGPARETLPEPVQRLSGGDRIEVLGHALEVIDVPGHTAGHIAYYSASVPPAPLLFCGDTLFSGGCGRLFEGTPAQMLASLDRLSALPDTTRVCGTHEYTLSNLRFARAVEPDNAELAAYTLHCEALRADGRPTLPSRLDLERRINPFLRSRTPSVRAGLNTQLPELTDDDVAVFTALREWKNRF